MNGVVEIARRLAVNRDDGQAAEITAAHDVGRRDLLLSGARFGEHFVGENMWQVMFADDDLDIHADFAGAAENFDDASDGSEAAFGVARDFHIHDGAIEFREARVAHCRWAGPFGSAQFFSPLRRQFFTGRNGNFVENARVVRKNHIALRAVAEQADERGMRALEDLHHTAFGAAVGAASHDAREDAIAVNGVDEIFAADVKVAIHSGDWRIGDQKAVAIAVRDDFSRN